VHLARVVGPGGFLKWVAIKSIRREFSLDQNFVGMLLDEARIAARLEHPNVCQVLDLGEERGQYFVVMEYLHGEHLADVASMATTHQGRLPLDLSAHIVAQAARGLHHAHEARGAGGAPLEVVHRDVSPRNTFITYHGAVKVTDFGVASAAGRITSTEYGRIKGKIAYMSPEQVQGELLDRRSDVFALGIMLFELTTGQRLYTADSEMKLMMRVSEASVPRPSSVVAGYPPELEEIVLRVLARQPSERYATAEALADDLEAFVGTATGVEPSTRLSRTMNQLFADRILAKDGVLEYLLKQKGNTELTRKHWSWLQSRMFPTIRSSRF